MLSQNIFGLKQLSSLQKLVHSYDKRDRTLFKHQIFNKSKESSPNNIQQVGHKIYNQFQQQNDSKSQKISLLKFIINQFGRPFFWCYILKQSELLLKIAFSILISLIFDNFQEANKDLCYVYAAFTGLVWIIISVLNQNSWKIIELTSIEIKGSVISAIYRKILTLNSNSLGTSECGQILSTIVQFHDILENYSLYIIHLISAPLAIVGITALLVWKIGWVSIAGVSFLLLCELIHYKYANYNSQFYDKIASIKDERMGILSDVISSFRYIKMQNWQHFFTFKIRKIRERQMKKYMRYGLGKGIEVSISEGVSPICMLMIIGITSTFSSLSSKSIIQAVLNILLLKLIIIYSSYGISSYFQISVFMKRIEEVLTKPSFTMKQLLSQNNPEQNQQMDKYKNNSDISIILQDVSCSYSKTISQSCILQKINLKLMKGSFIGVIGKIGSGKTTLLRLIAKQVPFYSGHIQILQQTCFYQSQPALFAGTIQENVILGKLLEQDLYRKALEYSCLAEDIQNFAEGDLKLVDEGGNNFSGGQKTRISLARAIYSESPLMLLDDPLSALDSKVCNKVVQNLYRLCRQDHKTIMIVINQVSLLKGCDRFIIIMEKTVKNEEIQQNTLKYTIHQQVNGENIYKSNICLNNKVSFQMVTENIVEQPKANLFAEQGYMKSFFNYLFLNKWNRLFFPLAVIFYIGTQIMYGLFIIFINYYDNVKQQNSYFSSSQSLWITLGVFAAIIPFLQFIRVFFLNLTLQCSNLYLHNKAIKKILGAQVLELDKMGTKNIIDKFSVDLGILDIGLLNQQSIHFTSLFLIVIQLILIAITNPIIIAFAFGMIFAVFLWYSYILGVVNSLKKIDMQQKGPIISFVSETLKGMSQIRGYKAEDHMIQIFQEKLERYMAASTKYRKINRLFTTITIYICLLFTIGSYLGLIAMIRDESYMDFMFAAVFLIDINDCCLSLVLMSSRIASTLVSSKRLQQLSELRQEESKPINNIQQTGKEQIYSERKLASSSPLQKDDSSVSIQNLSVNYGSSQALSNINIKIKKNEKIAIIGRTGSGKSSIVQALFRLIEAAANSHISIYGRNILEFGIRQLRQNYSCIPQTPFIFKDTLRANIDPLNLFKDSQILQALSKVCIQDSILSFRNNLNTFISTAENQLSAGERQLICLARVLLRNSPILVLDEATAYIDSETDKVIQSVIRKEFVGKTVIAVAHRLSTIADFDQIVVLQNGRILEIGSPKQLWQNKGEFFQMAQSNSKQALIIRQIIEKQNS